jgi:hypothetical protein
MGIDFTKPQTSSSKTNWLIPILAICVFLLSSFELNGAVKRRDRATVELNPANQKLRQIPVSNERKSEKLIDRTGALLNTATQIEFEHFIELLETIPQSSMLIAEAQYDRVNQKVELRTRSKNIASLMRWIEQVNGQTKYRLEMQSTQKLPNEADSIIEALIVSKREPIKGQAK